VVWLRTAPFGTGQGRGDGEHGADIVLDLHDATWPVIRRVSERLDPDRSWYPRESRAFFAARASSWDTRFGDDMPAYARAVIETGIPAGGVVLDAGCGTGRALPALRVAAGADGTVIGLDITPEMLAQAGHCGRADFATLVLGDARRLPLADRSVDVVFAAGLVMHLPDLTAGLTELARVVRPGGRLAIFHASGRAALAARHGRALRPDDVLHEHVLIRRLTETGWTLIRYEDPPDRFFALAARTG
jgi:SAM-dependent methyltransferase